MIVLGIVGAPAGGKSTVAGRLQELGATWINADLIAREVLEQGAVQATLVDRFGDQITGTGGMIDRQKLASRVFGDDDANRAALSYLESVLHPPTRREITNRLRKSATQGAVAAILDVPLLFESKWDRSCDEIWCIDASPDLRRQRSAGRGWDEQELRRREQQQLAMQHKKRLSNHVILNNTTLADLYRETDAHWNRLIQNQTNNHDTHCITDAPLK